MGRSGIVGDRVEFAGRAWRVLDVRGDCALLIAGGIVERRPYNRDRTGVSWEDCTLRRWLDGDFFGSFSRVEQERVVATRNVNAANPWFGTEGGADTTDRVFLLSLQEVVRYFGDSGQLADKNPDSKLFINDQYKSARKAVDAVGGSAWWWLRSPGLRKNTVAQVYNGGAIHVSGHFVDNSLGGVRPALWLERAGLTSIST
jgi:hypothetical protein